jgi:DNA-binding NarL/FixJ family response regulator
VAPLKSISQDGCVIEISTLENVAVSLSIKGFSHDAIAFVLGLKVRSVKKLLENVHRKLDSIRSQNNERRRFPNF